MVEYAKRKKNNKYVEMLKELRMYYNINTFVYIYICKYITYNI